MDRKNVFGDSHNKVPNFVSTVSSTSEAKLLEVLHKITSVEVEICSDGTKEFIKLLKSEGGGNLLRYFVKSSANCTELTDAWKLRRKKPGMSYIFKLVYVVLSHYEGKFKPNDVERLGISRVLDKFARLLIKEYMGDVSNELSSKDGKNKKAALLLLAAIVRRGSGLASDIAKNFDFKNKEFVKLAVSYTRRQNERQLRKLSLRKAFVGFAMSFLEVGKPGLLRWVLHQKEMYSGVLRGLGNDDDETVVYVLSILRNKVLVKESQVPPALRSVLFGSMTLEHLVNICEREDDGPSLELAHDVLVRVCTDPSNGLMPDVNQHPGSLKGNPKRIRDLMKKLKATTVKYHRDLLLGIVNGRMSFGAAYLEEFPYNIEDFVSPSWFATISLAADVVSSVSTGLNFDILNIHSESYGQSVNDGNVRSIMGCLFPRLFSRSLLNKGLLHSNLLIKHGTLRLLLELLELLDSVMGALNQSSYSNQFPSTLKEELQNAVQTLLPDPQVIMSLLSSFGGRYRSHGSSLKRDLKNDDDEHVSNKKKSKLNSEVNVDTCISMIEPASDIVMTGGERFTTNHTEEILLLSKLLDALRIYLRSLPSIVEGSFEFLLGLLNNPLELPTCLQHSLLSLLVEYIGSGPKNRLPVRTPQPMYKHLKLFIELFLFSPITEIRDQAHKLAKAAMSSTGAFDGNLHEIEVWLMFLPGYDHQKPFNVLETKVLQRLSSVVISFICDAISTIGNNLFRYWKTLMQCVSCFDHSRDLRLSFSPLTICVLEKCLRLLQSKSGNLNLCEKSMVLLYVCNTLTYLAQTQVDVRLFSAILAEFLSERCQYDSAEVSSEWKSLDHLRLFLHDMTHQQARCTISNDEMCSPCDSSFARMLAEVRRLLTGSSDEDLLGIVIAFISSIICVDADIIVRNLPSVLIISKDLSGIPISFLSSVLFLENSLLARAFTLFPALLSTGVGMAISSFKCDGMEVNIHGTSCSGVVEQANLDQNFDAIESEAGAAAFSLFLRKAPFHVLFPALMCVNGPFMLEPSRIQELLLLKLSEPMTDSNILSNLRLVLSWIHQIQSLKIKPSVEFEKLWKACIFSAEHLIALLLGKVSGCVIKNSLCSSSQNILEVAKTIFHHPVVLESLSLPFGFAKDFAKGSMEDCLHLITTLASKRSHKSGHQVSSMLVTTLDFLLSTRSNLFPFGDIACKQLLKDFNGLVERLFKEVKGSFEQCMVTEDLMPLLPIMHTLQTLIEFMSPLELLKLVDWMLILIGNSKVSKSCIKSALSVVCLVASGAFNALSKYLQHPIARRVQYDLLWGICEKNVQPDIIYLVYSKVVKLITSSKQKLSMKLEFADKWLVEAINALYSQSVKCQDFHSISLQMWRIVMITPVEVLPYCLYNTNITKSRLLFLLTEMSPLHSSIFGYLFVDVLRKSLDPRDNWTEGASNGGCLIRELNDLSLSEDQFLMLLPASLSYLDSFSRRFGKQCSKHFDIVSSYYSTILVHGFVHWRSFVTKDIFQEDFEERWPVSTQELLHFVNNSLLKKCVEMLHYQFLFSEEMWKVDTGLKLLDSLFYSSAQHDELVEFDIREGILLNEALNIVNRVIVKISVCKMLLFPEEGSILREVTLVKGSNLRESLLQQFMTTMVCMWKNIVERFPFIPDQCDRDDSAVISSLFNRLENILLKDMTELTVVMCDNQVKLHSISTLEQLIVSTLDYRFDDPATLKMLCIILSSLRDRRLSYGSYLGLVLSHSQFAPTIQSIHKLSDPSTIGSFTKPVSSILRSLFIRSADQNKNARKPEKKVAGVSNKQVEIVKLLRMLLHLYSDQHKFDPGNDFAKELESFHLKLLFCYSATLSEIDLQIYSLMREIESLDESVCKNYAKVGYLWGAFASKVNKDLDMILDKDESCGVTVDSEGIYEQCRCLFRENFPIDSNVCVSTVLYFPYHRKACEESVSKKDIRSGNIHDLVQEGILIEEGGRYDPVFILRFSIHCLSMGYIEPAEFAASGLLGVAFVSITSPDAELRRLAVDTLSAFKETLEKCQKREDVMQLQLLLASFQNSIKEGGKSIPSIIALFATEASCILLDPSHEHHAAVSASLMQHSSLNLKGLPMSDVFRSTSAKSKTERLWFIRLVYAGMNSDDDAHIYIKDSILQTLMSFYVSPQSDIEAKNLILEVVKKSIKSQKMSLHLVSHCLFSWLSSIISNSMVRLNGDGKKFFLLQQVALIFEVIHDVTQQSCIIKWLQKHELGQLQIKELSSNLLQFILGDVTLVKKEAQLLDSLLRTIESTLKLSAKSNIFQSHLSIDDLYEIYKAIDLCVGDTDSINSVSGLEVILLSAPTVSIFQMDQQKLSSFLTWMALTAIKSDSEKMSLSREGHQHFPINSVEHSQDDLLVGKLLHWLAASVITGETGRICDNREPESPESFNARTLKSFLKHLASSSGKRNQNKNSSKELLASTIFYLQYLLGFRSKMLPSVVAALCILVCGSMQSSADILDLLQNHGDLVSHIRYPAEADPTWTWAFSHPEDVEVPTDAQFMGEQHACLLLLKITSSMLSENPSELNYLSLVDVERDVLKWERSFVGTNV